MFFLSDLFDLFKSVLLVVLAIIAILLSPFAITGMIDSIKSDMGPVWTKSVNSGFTPDCH